jgi:hypothetical protein
MRNVHLKFHGSKGDRVNYQIPSTNNQIMFQISMSRNSKNNNKIKMSLGHSNFGHWNLFGAWNLVIGIYFPRCHKINRTNTSDQDKTGDVL